MSTRLVDLTLVLHRETERAWHVSESGDPGFAVWIPKSQADCGERVGGDDMFPVYEFTMPEWLAVEKRLI